jgi:hypothetical protein
MSQHQKSRQKKKRIGKFAYGTSIKRRCQCHFVAKQPYMDSSLCHLIYKCSEHTNKDGDQCHGTMVVGFRNALSTSLTVKKKEEISSMLDFGLTPSQVMAQYK